ncbi:MAG: aspartate-semialdehyde dehydrogenase [Deltaproteobacteria bacterium]|nr:aspartate-semialdehyde dehydrogenase [Deltaproteobacteria bacterium]
MQKKQNYNIAIAGATGAVGIEMIQTLEKRNFPVGELRLLASARSVGKELEFKGKKIAVQELTQDSFKDIDIALFSAGGDRSKEFADAAVAAGAVVIDNSSAFRMTDGVPLVVPEVNPEAVKNHKGIIANPNCTTIIMLVAVNPIHKINPIKRITVSSYQAVSGAGAMALEELRTQQKDLVEGRQPKAEIFSHVIVNNVFSHDSKILENGFNQEEYKMVQETKKILGDQSIEVAPTCVRVPIERAHSESISLELTQPVDFSAVTKVLNEAPGVKIMDDRQENHFPMPLDVAGKYETFVGRVRADLDRANVLHCFVCGDQLLKGAALNAVQIAELLANDVA